MTVLYTREEKFTDWNRHMTVLMAAMTNDETEDFRPKRWCPKCGNHGLVRQKTPFYLRALRPLGVRLGRYTCERCDATLILRRIRK